jgi:hypothetical protein
MRALSFVAALALVGCGPILTYPDGGGIDAAMDDAGPDAWAPDAYVPPDAFLPDDPGPARAIFVLPTATSAFFDLPWPTDLRRDAMGHPDLTGFVNPHSALLDRYIAAIEARQVGFALNGSTYFRFSRAVDETTLPTDLAGSTDAMSSVYLLDVDPRSTTLGQRLPITVRYQHLATVYWPDRTIGVRPPDGMPLEGGHTYAVVVTNRVHARDGTAFGRDADFQAIVDGTAPAASIAPYQPALDALAGHLDDVIALTVFTTQDPLALAFRLRDYVRNTSPLPTPVADMYQRGIAHMGFDTIVGHYGPVPIFQSGTIPYVTEGGDIDLDDGTVVEGTFNARFALAIPRTPMPAAGYPIVLYSHGTGGDYVSFIDDGTASRLTALGFAVMGIDQIHHGERNPTMVSPDLLFFNLQNPDAMRFNFLESGIDIVSQARFAPTMVIPTALFDRMGAAIHFDGSNMWYFGHSQGGLVAPIYLGLDDGVHGGVISEGGGLAVYALTEKLQPVSIPSLVQAALGLRTTLAGEGFDSFHPVVTLLQGWIEPSEPVNYARMIFDRPREGYAPKSIFMTEGGMDPYTPPPAIEALAVAMRIPQVDPISHPIDTLDFLGIPGAGPSATANVAGGMATAGLLQFPSEGHFAVFENMTCQTRYEGFFTSVLTGGPGTIPAAP